jgi:uncharacterized hydrophobic protein (TIGR00271 family)
VFLLRAFADPDTTEAVIATLEAQDHVRHIVLGGVTSDTGKALVTAEVDAESADASLEALLDLGLHASDLSVSKVDFARPVGPDGIVADAREDHESLVWTVVVDAAAESIGLRPTYLVYMLAAGVIAAFGVAEGSSVLIVGAMAVSPDLLPMSAACVALAALRRRLFAHALSTLLPGLLLAVVAAYLLTLVLRAIGQVSAATDIQSGVIGDLATVNVATVGVALAAGVAGMLAFENRAGAAVGVAISVTTIPAAAYIGVAAGISQWHGALGALTVLVVNLGLLFLAGTLTIIAQAAHGRHHGQGRLPHESRGPNPTTWQRTKP